MSEWFIRASHALEQQSETPSLGLIGRHLQITTQSVM